MKTLSIVALGSVLPAVIVLLSAQILPDDSTTHYAGSGVCAQCHDGLRGSSGEDVSIANDWRSTMMANAAKDPLWQVKVYSETTRNPELAGLIEDKCATCHMPMAHSQLILGEEKVSFWGNGLLNKEHPLHGLAMDGVSCTLCHQITEENLASDESYSGHFLIDPEARRPDRGIFGPYPNPGANPMRNTARFTPRYSGQVQIYEVIMGDLAGNVTYTLLEASDRLKDNRLLPAGFSKADASGDIRVEGEAREDEGFIGGSDVVTYQIPLGGTNPPYRLRVELLYQSISYSFWRDLLEGEEMQGSPAGESVRKLGDINRPIVVSSAEKTLR